MNVFELFAVLTLNKDDYEKNLNTAEQKSKSWTDKIQDLMKNKAVVAFGLVAKAVIEVIKQINKLMLDTMNYADAVGDLAAQYGVTTDAISEMQYIADQSSTSVEQLTSSMTMLLNRAKENGDGFKELGVDVYDANGNLKQMDELFYETIGALNSVESEGEKSRLMLETFGRSAMNVGEVLRKSTDEITAMRQEAHELGIVMEEETINFASDMNDMMAVLKLQGQSALASLIGGEEDAEEKLQKFFDSVIDFLDTYTPTLINFGLRLLLQLSLAIIRILPSLVLDIGSELMYAVLELNWFQLGIDIGKSVIEGLLNVVISTLNRTLGVVGVKIPKANLNVGENIFSEEELGAEYEISENVRQEISVKVEASGDSAVSEETAEKTAKALAPYIDKILGGM